jgi:hypothetical protein
MSDMTYNNFDVTEAQASCMATRQGEDAAFQQGSADRGGLSAAATIARGQLRHAAFEADAYYWAALSRAANHRCGQDMANHLPH